MALGKAPETAAEKVNNTREKLANLQIEENKILAFKEVKHNVGQAMEEVEDKFREQLAVGLTDRAVMRSEALLTTLKFPLKRLIADYGYYIAENIPFKRDQLAERTENLKEMAINYMGLQLSKYGKTEIDEEMIIQMTESPESYDVMANAVSKTSDFYEALTVKQRSDLVQITQWVLQVSDDIEGEKPHVFGLLQKYIGEKYHNETFTTSAEMAIVWQLLANMEPKYRKEFMQNYLPSAPVSGSISVHDFLIAGNEHGVFTLEEMAEYDSAFASLSASQTELYLKKYTLARNVSKEVDILMGESYGAKNKAAEMLTMGNILKTAAKGVLITTFVANVGVGMFKDGKLGNPLRGLNANSVGAALAFSGIKYYEQLGEGKEYSEKTAINEFKYLRQSPSTKKWKEFLFAEKGDGGMVFADFIAQFDPEEPLPEKQFTTKAFEDYLAKKAANRQNSEPDYQEILEKFKLAKAASPEVEGEFRSYGRMVRHLHIQETGRYDAAVKQSQNI